MYVRRKSTSSLGGNNRNSLGGSSTGTLLRRTNSIGSCNSSNNGSGSIPACRNNNDYNSCSNNGSIVCKTSSKLFQPGVKIIVQRAPILNGLTTPAGLAKKFQRPMLKRRAYGRNADDALKRSSLGPRKRMDGMAKLMARAGRGLSFQLSSRTSLKNASDGSGSEDDEKEPEQAFEPLRVWESPHNGGEAKGIRPVLYVIIIIVPSFNCCLYCLPRSILLLTFY